MIWLIFYYYKFLFSKTYLTIFKGKEVWNDMSTTTGLTKFKYLNELKIVKIEFFQMFSLHFILVIVIHNKMDNLSSNNII